MANGPAPPGAGRRRVGETGEEKAHEGTRAGTPDTYGGAMSRFASRPACSWIAASHPG